MIWVAAYLMAGGALGEVTLYQWDREPAMQRNGRALCWAVTVLGWPLAVIAAIRQSIRGG